MSLNKTWILTCHGPASEMLSGHLPCSSANSWTESRPYRKQTSRLLGTTPPSSTKCRTSVPPESQASVVTNWPLRAPQGNCPSSLNCAASTPHWGPSTEKRGRHFPFFHQSLKTKPRTNLSLLQIVLTLTPWPPQAVWTSRHPLPARWTHPFRAAPGFEHLATVTLTSPQGASGVLDASSGPEEAPSVPESGYFPPGAG